MTERTHLDRRTFLGGAATAGIAATIAGCNSILGGGPELAYGSQITNRITSDDPRDPYYDDLSARHTFEGSAGDRVEISMTSTDFDTYLVLEGPNGNMVSEDDDGGREFNSVLETQLPQDGIYTIWAGSFSGTATGQYRLTLNRA